MLQLASQLAHGVACRTAAEAQDQAAARAQRAAEWRHDKIQAVVDAASAKRLSRETLALIDLAAVKGDAANHAMVTMAAAQEAAKQAAANKMAAAEATAARAMSAGSAVAKHAFFTTALIASAARILLSASVTTAMRAVLKIEFLAVAGPALS
ncbi:hypothetical protein HK105_209416 [Polyrhizophydium stewartii]|uniref:Antifreeze protein n=1 Tax=Polyrhizophydium stewartii TaxID=2732419 RepID=A0ABR4MV32_9FUNG